MMRKYVSLFMVALVLFATTSALMPATASAQAGAPAPKPGLVVPISQLTTNATANPLNVASIVGSFNINSFQVVNGALAAVGTLTVNLLDTAGGVLQTVTIGNFVAPITLPNSTASCTILTLDIGAINVDLLGLIIDLSPIHLNITAQPGPGNLLGNLLCDVANLLNNNGPLTQLATLLNRLLGAL